jgi:[ribosomal protein S5]-alanine N-acetyltransferase
MRNLLKPNYDLTMEGRSIIMRPIELSDINARYLSWLNNPEINRFLEFSKYGKQTFDDVVKYVNKRRSAGMEVFGIRTKKDNIFVGTTGYVNWENTIEYKKAEYLGLVESGSSNVSRPIGFGLMIGDKRAQSIGIGGEAYIYNIEFIFRVLKVDMIFNMAALQHSKVVSIGKRTGFKIIHTFKNHIELSDRICDGVILTMTNNEWSIRKPAFQFLLDKFKIKFNC